MRGWGWHPHSWPDPCVLQFWIRRITYRGTIDKAAVPRHAGSGGQRVSWPPSGLNVLPAPALRARAQWWLPAPPACGGALPRTWLEMPQTLSCHPHATDPMLAHCQHQQGPSTTARPRCSEVAVQQTSDLRSASLQHTPLQLQHLSSTSARRLLCGYKDDRDTGAHPTVLQSQRYAHFLPTPLCAAAAAAACTASTAVPLVVAAAAAAADAAAVRSAAEASLRAVALSHQGAFSPHK